MSSDGDPTIYSLDELQVQVTDELRLYLSSQYNDLYKDNGDESAAMRHLDRILSAMKTAPATITCRVNLVLSNQEEVMEGLKRVLTSWKNRHSSELLDESDTVVVTSHSILSDVVCVRPTANAAKRAASRSLMKCRIPPPNSTLEPKDEIFVNWPRRAQKGWPMNYRVVICDRFCGEAVLRGSDIFVRGVLCADSGIQPSEVVAVYADLKAGTNGSLPRGLLLESYEGTCVFLGLGMACCKRADIFSFSKGVAVQMSSKERDRAGPPLPPLNGIMPDKMMLQNLPSVLVAHVLAPQQGEVILDMCSAPGGKTSHVACLVRNNATIVACDKSRKKMVSAREFFLRMGATCITPLAWDSTSCVTRDSASWKSAKEIISSAIASEKDGLLNVSSFFPESFDRIVLDPPCSALGLRPKLQIEATTSRSLKKHVNYQKLFVREAVALLKPGGTMTYSTCTINAFENEHMVRHISDEYPSMKLAPIQIELGLSGLPGTGLTDAERSMVRRFDPSDAADTMGFFVAKFIKDD